MNSKPFIPKLIYCVGLLTIIFSMLLINSIYKYDNLYGSFIFLIQLKPIEILSSLIIFIIIFYFFKKLYERSFCDLEKYSTKQKFIFIFLSSLFFKLLLINFNLVADDVSPLIDDVFLEEKFNQYKLYSFIVLLVSKLTSDYNFYLTLINIIFGSLSISILYLIFSTFKENNARYYLGIILTLLYVPLNVIEILLRVDTLFLFLFLLTIYFLFKQINSNTLKNLFFLNLTLFFSCLCRESTIYMLPLFLLIIFFANKNRFKSGVSIILTVILTTNFLMSFNEKNYGMKSFVKDYHLIYNMMHYGYFNDNIALGYTNKLSPEAQSLHGEIKLSYENNVPPHKRKSFNDSHLGGLNRSIWYLIRPDKENIVIKSTMTPYTGDFNKVKNILRNSIKNVPENVSFGVLDQNLTNAHSKIVNPEDRELAKYVKSQLFYVFLIKVENLDGWPKGKCYTADNQKKGIYVSSTTKFNRDCVIQTINNISENYISNRSDNWSYKRAAIPFTWRFDKTKKIHIQHPNIKYVEEIAMSIPTLYVTQSVLSLFGMSGYVPVPSGIGQMAQIYQKSILPNIFLIYFQAMYAVIMNFWYVFSFFVLVSSIFIEKDRDTRVREFIIGVIPIYYGLFLVFAVHFEFARLMIPIVPFIIYNFLVTISVVLEVLKDTYVLFWNSARKK